MNYKLKLSPSEYRARNIITMGTNEKRSYFKDRAGKNLIFMFVALKWKILLSVFSGKAFHSGYSRAA